MLSTHLSFQPPRTIAVGLAALGLIGTAWTSTASAAPPVGLGTAAPFACLAGTAVTAVPLTSLGLNPDGTVQVPTDIQKAAGIDLVRPLVKWAPQ